MNYSVSVIIPSYNRAHTLPRAVGSVLNQIGSQFELEIIIVDDGSTDDTADLALLSEPNIRYIYQQNQGVSAARNVGLAHAGHAWVALLDSDDEWLPNKLQRQFIELESSGLFVCHSDERWVRNGVRVNAMHKHKKQGGWLFQACLPLCVISPSATVMHRDVFVDVGHFDESLPACEDYDLWLRLTAKYEVAYIDEPLLVKYGGHSDQLSRKYWGMDRFRVKALLKHVETNLPDNDKQALISTLREKLSILLAGAQKRSNSEMIEYCQNQLSELPQLM